MNFRAIFSSFLLVLFLVIAFNGIKVEAGCSCCQNKLKVDDLPPIQNKIEDADNAKVDQIKVETGGFCIQNSKKNVNKT